MTEAIQLALIAIVLTLFFLLAAFLVSLFIPVFLIIFIINIPVALFNQTKRILTR